MVDVIFADVAQPDQARIVALNAHYFLKNGGHFVISIKASCIDSTAAPEAVFAREVKKLQGKKCVLYYITVRQFSLRRLSLWEIVTQFSSSAKLHLS